MSNERRALAWASGAVAVLICTVVGLLLFKAGLDKADKWASVIGMSVTVLIGLPLSVYQMILARRALTSSTSTAGVDITAKGARSIAAQTIGSAATGDGSSPTIEVGSPAPRPSPDVQPSDRSEAERLVLPTQVQIEAAGERSIAAQTIGSASTGDLLPRSAAG
ncbi:hypothetical protein AB0L53_54955 [Nonomuraea sp. NPDC052129]|uniref:hypothetical protein n=1 Tax=Nonomuraea sp. NPDC052129 TaxID=3154651 RepID=UPI0034123BAC